MSKKVMKMLNTTILSMITKQELLDSLNSEVFSVDIYRHYIDILIEANMELFNGTAKKEEYKSLINEYLEGNIENPDNIIELLKNNA